MPPPGGSISTASFSPVTVTVPTSMLVGYGMHSPSRSHVSSGWQGGSQNGLFARHRMQSPSSTTFSRIVIGTTPSRSSPCTYE